eukprot:4326055-Amphidinium_carterae.1
MAQIDSVVLVLDLAHAGLPASSAVTAFQVLGGVSNAISQKSRQSPDDESNAKRLSLKTVAQSLASMGVLDDFR